MTGVDGRRPARSAGVLAPQRPACDVALPGRRSRSTRWDRLVLPAPRCGRFPAGPVGTGAARSRSRPGADPVVGVDPDGSRPPVAVCR
jgi:hypothetical protein